MIGVVGMTLDELRKEVGQEPIDLYAKWGYGIENDANVMEIRLAIGEYRKRHGRDRWRLYAPEMARC